MARLKVLVLGVVAVLALTACSRQAPEVEANAQVPADQRTEAAAAGATEGGGDSGATWVAVDIDFASAPEELPAGPVEITIDNQGSAQHNVTIPDVQAEPIVEAAGGETVSDTVEMEPGTYEYFCSVPGHETLMNGEVTVG